MFGIDVSHHQNPATLDWARFNGVVDFVIARSSYGAKLRDRQVAEHIARARAIGAKVGIYHFFRYVHDVRAQWDLMRSVADAVGIGPGDIVPTIDIERDPIPAPGRDVSQSWSGPCLQLAELVRAQFGECMIYITQREWGMLGSPLWVLQRPIWCAHFTNAPTPASPGGVQPTLWQYRVGPFDPNGAGGYVKARPELDHNRALRPLPLIGGASDEGIEEAIEQKMIDHDAAELIDEHAVMSQVAVSLADLGREIFDEPEPERNT